VYTCLCYDLIKVRILIIKMAVMISKFDNNDKNNKLIKNKKNRTSK
jgi:hypothetical protein